MAHSIVIEMIRSLTSVILGHFLFETNFEIHYFPGLIQTDIMRGKRHNGTIKQSRLMTINSY